MAQNTDGYRKQINNVNDLCGGVWVPVVVLLVSHPSPVPLVSARVHRMLVFLRRSPHALDTNPSDALDSTRARYLVLHVALQKGTNPWY